MSKHTPGPWRLWGSADPSQVISAADCFVAQTIGGNDEANARLIAAAPALLEALLEERRLRLLGQQPDVHWESLREERRAACAATDAAIAAATGTEAPKAE